MCSTPSTAHLFYYSCHLMLARSACMCVLRVLGAHVKEQKHVTTCLETRPCFGHIELSLFKVRRVKNVSVHTCMHTDSHTKSTTSHSSTRGGLPMRQMRSERSHIKQPNLSCFAFIAPVHFHNALKPPLRREGDMERKKTGRGQRE